MKCEASIVETRQRRRYESNCPAEATHRVEPGGKTFCRDHKPTWLPQGSSLLPLLPDVHGRARRKQRPKPRNQKDIDAALRVWRASRDEGDHLSGLVLDKKQPGEVKVWALLLLAVKGLESGAAGRTS